MRERALVTIVLVPVGILAIQQGGWVFAAVVGFFLLIAAWEYARMFQACGYQPSTVLVVGGVLGLLVGRVMHGMESAAALVSLLILASITYHLIAYERGRDQAGTDFAVTLSGVLYIGFIGAYLISLRDLPNGIWWVLITLPAVWLSDTGAYLIGSAIGRHPMVPRLSPKKTWEGYVGGIVFGTALNTLLTWMLLRWTGAAGSGITLWHGAIMGVVMGILPTLGDLGESMIKRQAHLKDSGHLFPGHGGAFDRIDSWLWAAVIGYYMIVYWMLP
jgi:phosphatidate cytidylyltransferase